MISKVHKRELIPQSLMLATGSHDPLKLGVDERRFAVFHDPARLRELQALLCPPHQFAWRNDGKAECVKCGQVRS